MRLNLLLIIVLIAPLVYGCAVEEQKSLVYCQEKPVAVLYSGGLDSSAVVATLASRGVRNIHLITIDNGAQDHIDYAKIKLEDFKRQFPSTIFTHVILTSRYLFKKVALVDIESDLKAYGTNLVCVGCKMAMHAMAIIYALQNKIDIVADGFAKRQEDFPEQDIAFIEEMINVYKRYNLHYDNPLYYKLTDKDAAKDILSSYNLSTKSVEPGCLFGGTFSRSKTENIRAYLLQKNSYID